ncbi:MAG: hypothetical protein XE07_2018 [Methanothrix harundinacea]|uniref:Uncharacterized protein n=1 Tax=Methanothrix harundinacea TaxID=301375 RepID=A0A101IGP2_9EURY|nr:MAG: hypothetical protein XE07_2018 [Methanothrix harundinacea]
MGTARHGLEDWDGAHPPAGWKTTPFFSLNLTGPKVPVLLIMMLFEPRAIAVAALNARFGIRVVNSFVNSLIKFERAQGTELDPPGLYINKSIFSDFPIFCK